MSTTHSAMNTLFPSSLAICKLFYVAKYDKHTHTSIKASHSKLPGITVKLDQYLNASLGMPNLGIRACSLVHTGLMMVPFSIFLNTKIDIAIPLINIWLMWLTRHLNLPKLYAKVCCQRYRFKVHQIAMITHYAAAKWSVFIWFP